jgi:oxygen-dependent protoporphyrinogen oxidase
MGTLPERLAERIEAAGAARLRATVTSLERFPSGGWRVVLAPRPGDAAAIEADGVVVALPAPIAARVVAAADDPLAVELAGIEYAGSAVVVLGYAREQVAHPLDAAGVVVPRVEGRRALAVSFSSAKFPGRAPHGHVLLRVFLGGALDPERNLLDDDQLVALAREELAAIVGASGPPRLVEIARWPAAMPQYHLGHLQRIDRLTRRLDALPGLALAGAAYEGVGIPQVIASGQAAAARVMASLRAAR